MHINDNETILETKRNQRIDKCKSYFSFKSKSFSQLSSESFESSSLAAPFEFDASIGVVVFTIFSATCLLVFTCFDCVVDFFVVSSVGCFVCSFLFCA